MKKSPLRTTLKFAFTTLGILSLLFAAFNPAVHYFGGKTDATLDAVSSTQIDGNQYRYDIRYRYYVAGSGYADSYGFTDRFDETLSEKSSMSVRYFPLVPTYCLPDPGYRIPAASLIFAGIGLFFLILGLLLKTHTRESVAAEEEAPAPAVFRCPSCHKVVDADSIFCNHCGEKMIK